MYFALWRDEECIICKITHDVASVLIIVTYNALWKEKMHGKVNSNLYINKEHMFNIIDT